MGDTDAEIRHVYQSKVSIFRLMKTPVLIVNSFIKAEQGMTWKTSYLPKLKVFTPTTI